MDTDRSHAWSADPVRRHSTSPDWNLGFFVGVCWVRVLCSACSLRCAASEGPLRTLLGTN